MLVFTASQPGSATACVFLNATCEVFGSQHQRPAAHALICARVNSKPFFVFFLQKE